MGNTTAAPKLVMFATLALCLVLASCSGSEAPEPADASASQDDPSARRDDANPTTQERRHCFRNEFPFADDPENMDVEELLVEIEGDQATGTYSWLPAFKDQRVGDFQGTLVDGVIEATYTFSQEGQSTTASIRIVLDEERATVEGGSPELGLDTSINRIDCTR